MLKKISQETVKCKLELQHALISSLITLALYQTTKFLKAFEDVKLNVARMRISLFDREKKALLEKEKITITRIYSFFLSVS